MTAQPTYSPAPQTLAPAPAPKRRRTGRIVGFLSAPLVLAAVGAGALFAFGPQTVEPESVEREIVRITETAVQVTPADVTCPEGIEAQAGGTFTCTGTVDSQPVTYWVHQDDDQGNLTITYSRLLRLDAVEQSIAAKVSSDVEVDATVDCGPADRTVTVNAPGQPIDCTATNSADPTDGARLSVTVDAEGDAAYRFV
jgi:Domain of unknown function (DUF4333)